MQEFGIEESQLGSEIRQQRTAAGINVKFTHHAARFSIRLTGHPIRTCHDCGFANGSVSLQIDATFVHLDRHDRRFVFFLSEAIKAYEAGTLCFKGEEATHPPSERKMDLSIANVPDDDIPF